MMSNACLKGLIMRFRDGDSSAFYDIIEVFKGLIFKYSHKLKDEDSFQDLSLFLLELVHKISLDQFTDDDSDGLQRYIAVSLTHKYIVLSKEKQNEDILFDDLRVIDLVYDRNNVNYMLGKLSFIESLNLLSDKQKLVIVYRYLYGYSDNDIADKLNITRQAVNRMRNRGLKILTDFYCE